MKIDIIICLPDQGFCDGRCQSFHFCAIFSARENTVQIFSVFPADAACSLLKVFPVQHLYQNQLALYLFRLQPLRQLDQSLDPHILSCMKTCCDKDGFSRIFSTDDGCRKGEFSVSDFQETFCFFPFHNRKIQEMIRFYAGYHKHWGGLIIQSLLLTPDCFPDFRISVDSKKSCFPESFYIPLGTTDL